MKSNLLIEDSRSLFELDGQLGNQQPRKASLLLLPAVRDTHCTKIADFHTWHHLTLTK
jgi:hypothetical protein